MPPLSFEQPADDESVITWKDLDDEEAQILQARFVAWFQHEGGREVFKRAAHSVGGRDGDEAAVDAAEKCWEQWPDPRKREKFMGRPGYVFKTVRNVFLDGLKTSYKRREQQVGLPGHSSGEGDAAASVWNKLAADDPGWEVRNAMRSLNEAQAELLFLRFWLRLSQVKAAEHMGLTRHAAGVLYRSAIEELCKHLLSRGPRWTSSCVC